MRTEGYTNSPLLASAARTTSGTGPDDTDFAGYGQMRLQLAVTAVSGTTPTLDVVVEDTLDGVNYFVVGTFAQRTTTGAVALNVAGPFTDRVRVRWTIGGTTPSFTFSVLGFARGAA